MDQIEYLKEFIKDNGPHAFTIEELIDWLKSKHKIVDPLIISEQILSLPEVTLNDRVYTVSL